MKTCRKCLRYIFLIISFSHGTTLCESMNVSNIHSKIVIIGAGAAGIAAASRLFENGFNNVTILEAEDRIGGRIHTVQFGNYSIDLGAQWVHGQEGNVVYELAEPLGLLDHRNTDFEQEFIDSLGTPLSKYLSKKLSDFYNNYVFTEDFDSKVYKSVSEYVEKKFDQQFENITEILKEKNKYLRNMEEERMGTDPAESWNDIAANGVQQYKVYPGDQQTNWKKKGYKTILDILMKRYPYSKIELPIMNNTVLNTEVRSINYIANSTKGPSILISTVNGQLYKADYVIVTVPLGVLKEKHETLFIPPLPDYKVSAIEGIPFGNVAKIFLLFDEPFWGQNNERALTFAFIWNEAEKKLIESIPEKEWLLGMYGASTVEYKPNILLLWTTGKYAKMMEAISEDKVYYHAVENLHRFLDKKYNVTKPVAMLRTRWFTNSHFKGTYSYRNLEAERRKVFSEMLERPLTSDTLKIFFAGEATSTERFSTVDGAIGSGWKAADRLINYYESKH